MASPDTALPGGIKEVKEQLNLVTAERDVPGGDEMEMMESKILCPTVLDFALCQKVSQS